MRVLERVFKESFNNIISVEALNHRVVEIRVLDFVEPSSLEVSGVEASVSTQVPLSSVVLCDEFPGRGGRGKDTDGVEAAGIKVGGGSCVFVRLRERERERERERKREREREAIIGCNRCKLRLLLRWPADMAGRWYPSAIWRKV